MSADDIQLVSQVLLGVNSTEASIRTNSANKLHELKQNLGALSYCLLQIASKPINTKEDNYLKTSSLVILRKILDVDDATNWKLIPSELKNQIKLITLQLFVNETQPSFKSKICDVITEIIDKISEVDEDWPDFEKLAATVFTIDPLDESQSVTICSLLKLVSNGTGFLFDKILSQREMLIEYFKKVFAGKNIKMKIAACEFISEICALGKTFQKAPFYPLFFTMLEITLQLHTKKDEDNLKEIMQIIIEICNSSSKGMATHLGNLFLLSKKIFEDKTIEDEKVRELGLELLLELIERRPSLIQTKELKVLIESIVKYGLESEKEITKQWETPTINNYEDMKAIDEEKICTMQFLLDRLIECCGIDITVPILGELINNLISNNDWMFKYTALAILLSISQFEIEMELIQMAFPAVFGLTKSENPKIRYLAIYTINKFSTFFNPKFEKAYYSIVLPLLIELYSKETILRIQCEIIETLTTFIQFTNCEQLNQYLSKLFEICFGSFITNIPIILRKSIIELLIEIGSTFEDECQPYAEKSFEILINYFTQIYNTKSNKILYGGLIETLTIFGPYTQNTFHSHIPVLMQAMLTLIQGINSNTDASLISDLSSSLERIVPIIQEHFKNLIPALIESIFALMKIMPKVSTGNSNSDIDINDILTEDKKDKGMELNTEAMEDYANIINLLITIIESLKEEFAPFAEPFETELIPLTLYKFNDKIRKKASKVFTVLITVFNDRNVKVQKARLYIETLIKTIGLECKYSTCGSMIKYLSNVIENTETFLTRDELNKIFQKIKKFFDGVEHNFQLNKKYANTKKPVAQDDDTDDEDITDLIEDETDEIELLLSNLGDTIGMLLKTHKDVCDDMLNVIICEMLPKFTKEKSSTFEQKMGVYLSVDLIEFIGQQKLNAIWDNLFKQIGIHSNNKDNDLRQSACYGLGVFAQNTKDNFDNYAIDLITALKSAYNFPMDQNNKEDWYLAQDNITAAIGKVLYYQQSNGVVQKNINELLELWISHLPIKYDEEEQEDQHEWFTSLALSKRYALPVQLLPLMFNKLVVLYSSKASSNDINAVIEKIFVEAIQLPEMRVIIDEMYKTSENIIKKRIEHLISLK